MIDREYDAMRRRHCELLVQEHFHLHLPVDELLFDDIETGPRSYAVLFRSGKHTYALFVDDAASQTLSDVKSMMRHMGVIPNKILPPYADPLYFMREGKKHAAYVFPAIKSLDPETVAFYQTRATYAPGLVRIDEINGTLQRYATNISAWQPAFNYSFKKIQVSS